ncbi:MAG: hypothetical protein ACXVEE_11575 [Polyangiales bacterium]
MAVAAWVGASAISGCASEREPINRVQANAIHKVDLVGDFRNPTDAPEFYMRSLVLAVQRTNPWTSDGIQDLTRRVRFEVTEKFLIARNAYEFITTSDGQGGPRGKTNDGLIVSIWPIDSHFDIRRGYNSVTGEELNVVEENSTDRAWYEREYMRVDWSRNLINDPNAFFNDGGYGDDGNTMHLEPVAFYENDPNRWDASNFDELSNGGYFDLTSKWLWKPSATTYTDDWGSIDIPDCLLENDRLYNSSYVADPSIGCGAQEMTFRTSFYKVPTGDQSTDYETMEISPWQGNILGTINMSRSGYDRQYGIVDQTWHTFVQRFNIWKKSHTDTVCGQSEVKADADGACAAINPNSLCDMNAKRCTIPYTDRQVSPIAFVVDPDMPTALYPSTQKSIDEWSRAITRGVAYAREAECRRTGGDRADCHGRFFDGPIDPKKEDQPKADQGPTVVMCHNPIAEGDNPACGATGTKIRKGDIRHHMIGWWSNPSFERPLGVIVPSGDPISGENIGSIVNIFGASVETYTARARDQLQLINGDFSPSEYAAGIPRQLYDEGRIYDTDPLADPILDSFTAHAPTTPAPAMKKSEVEAKMKAINVDALQKAYGWSASKVAGMTDIQKKVAWYSHVKSEAAAGTPGFASATTYAAKIEGRVDALKKAGYEPKVAGAEWMAGSGIDPRLASDAKVQSAFSPLSGVNPTRLAMRKQKTMAAGGCKLKAPDLLKFDWQAGYAAKMKARYPDGAKASGPMADAAGVSGQTIDRVVRGKLIYRELLAPMYEFTLLHEMGHLMSMEHDFSGSWDSPNFESEYWILRANGDKKNMATCPDGGRDPATDNCMGPRWLDPVTTDEIGTTKGKEHDSIDSYAVASVMDYKFDSLYAAKLGPLDRMAAKYIYTGLVELFDDDQFSLIKNSSNVGGKYLSSLTLLNSEGWFVGGNEKHYTDVGRDLNLFDPGRCRPQTDAERAAGTGALGVVCAPVHKDHSFLRDMDAKLPSGGWPVDLTVQFAKDKLTGKIRWPYKVGDGETAYVHQWMYDNGADFYEITKDILERYELMYLDSFFRKGSRERDWESLPESLQGRFFDRVQSLQWNALADIVPGGAGVGVEGTDYMSEGKRLSLIMLFDSMQRSLLRPQPGAYALAKVPGAMFDLYSSNSESADPKAAFNLGAGDARYIDSKFDATKQYDFLAYGDRIGSFAEKPLAAIALTDSRPQLSTVERLTYLDGRNVMFSFRQAIPEAFDRLVAGVLADDWDTVAPYVDGTKDASGIASLQTLHLWETDVTKITRPAGSMVVDPMLGFRVKIPTLVLMMLYQPIDTNMELVNRTRIWRAGAVEAIDVPAAERVTFFDPVDGVEWTSRTFGTETLAGKVVEKGIGARMLQHANELLAAAYDVELEPVVGSTTQMQPKYTAGRPQKPGGGAIDPATPKNATAAAKLRDYIAFLNQVRLVFDVLGYGPCGRGESC